MANLREVLKRLREAGFKLNLGKCAFFQSKIKYLGHIINKDGLHKDPEKVEAIGKAPRPKNIQEVQAFVSMVNYYGRFVSGLSNILSPLYQAQRSKEFVWNEACEKAFVHINEEMKPYLARAREISIEKNVLIWGYSVLIPQKFRKLLLTEIHGTHLGMAKMKSIARQCFWWPNLDRDSEQYVRSCNACRSTAKGAEKTSLIKFREADYTYDRVHVDFLGPFHGKTYYIVVDAYPKWPEVFEMDKTDLESTIEKLRECFARFGLPRTIFSDNVRQFTSAEFAKFCKNNGITHKTSAPYHPSTNGLAENAMRSFKKGITRALKDGRNKTVSLSTLISRYLASYRNVPHSSTGETPAKLMFGRILRTGLDFLNRTVREKARESQIKYFHGEREVMLAKEIWYTYGIIKFRQDLHGKKPESNLS